MPNYDLFGLDPRTFQQLCQALAIAEIAPGVTVFGDGRDGARDASFRGKVNYPSAAEAWDGDLVIQMKYRQTRLPTTKEECAWVIKNLKADLNKFRQECGGEPQVAKAGQSRPIKREPPNYYLFVTNISLTSVPETGSDAKVRKVLREYADKLKLKGFDVWDGNKIQRLLDKHRDVAISYAGYITAGDVLTAMHTYLTDVRPEFLHVMSDYLQCELTGSEQYARLSEAGSTITRRSLASVFVDLPVADFPPGVDEDGIHYHEDESSIGFLREILRIGSLRLDRASILERRRLGILEDDEVKDPRFHNGRVVLIGGPGQGKSTLGQFICQLHRAAILQKKDPDEVTPEVINVVNLIQLWCEKEGVSLPKTRRFPVRVDLKEFADALANRKCNSLLNYIADRIDQRSARSVDRDDLARWLGDYPWLVVLDGLDEVPSSGNRDVVLDAIQEFHSQCATRTADVLIVATSRPQGYGDAFSSDLYWHRYLAPLSTMRAMSYAERLVEVCHVDDPDKQEEIVGRLKNASRNQNTKRLMLSPLQVTILAVLAELQGELPDDRWELFNEYYQTIYKRETQRNQALSPILRDYRLEIDQAHRQVGVQLQLLNEGAGKNDALLNRTQLGAILRSSLKERFPPGDEELDKVAESIETAALERLVFLVSPKAEDVGFEIRSIQEFMAAKAIVAGSDQDICDRLAAIAPFPFWSNVFLFAAGFCVRERSHIVEYILGLCTSLNNDTNQPEFMHLLAGSSLALSLLEDATCHRSQSHTNALLEIAMRLDECPSEIQHRRLASVCQRYRNSVPLIEAKLRCDALSTDAGKRVGAWRVLLNLIELGSPWAERLASELWPNASPDVKTLEMLSPTWLGATNPWLVKRIVERAGEVMPHHLVDAIADSCRPPWLAAYDELRRTRLTKQIPVITDQAERPSLGIMFMPIPPLNEKWEQLAQMPVPKGNWTQLVAVAEFVAKPSKESLADGLLKIAEECTDIGALSFDSSMTPWIFMCCVAHVQNRDDLKKVVNEVREGSFGDLDDWQKKEQEWLDEGIEFDKAIEVLDSPSLATVRSEPWIVTYRIGSADSAGFGAISRILQRIFNHQKFKEKTVYLHNSRSWIANLLWELVRFEGKQDDAGEIVLQAEQLRQVYSHDNVILVPVEVLEFLSTSDDQVKEAVSVLDLIGRSKKLLYLRPPFRTHAEIDPWVNFWANAIVRAYVSDPSQKGLLPWMIQLTIANQQCPRIPKRYLWPTVEDSLIDRRNQLSLLLYWGELSIDEAKELVHEAAEVYESDSIDWPDNFKSSFLSPHIDQDWAKHFVLDLVPLISPHNFSARSACFDWLAIHLAHRKSQLREKLGLTL